MSSGLHIPRLLITLAEFQFAPLPWWGFIQHRVQQLRAQEGTAVIFTQWKVTRHHQIRILDSEWASMLMP